MSRSVEETGLATITRESTELAQTSASATAQYEIQSAIVVARQFPRNEDAAFQRLMRACDRTTFAQDAEYIFPRGGSNVRGPSINVAREAARCWTNIRHGLDVIRDDEDERHIRAWCWDMEANVKVTAEDSFKKLIFRKNGGWIKPDERDLRELTNRRGAILTRNCILQVLPRDLIEDAISRCQDTLKKDAGANPEAARKKVILAFGDIGVTVEMLEKKLGHKIAESSPAEIAELRAIYASIKDGNSTWREYAQEPGGNGDTPSPPKNTGKLSMSDLKEKKEDPKAAAPSNGGGGGTSEPPATTAEGSTQDDGGPPKPGGKPVGSSKQKKLIDAWEGAGCRYDDLAEWLKHHGVPGGSIEKVNANQYDYLMKLIGRGEVEWGNGDE